MSGFGTPSSGGESTSTGNEDDDFQGMGLPEGVPTSPLGIYSAVCKGPKKINSENFQGMALEFEIVDDETFAGEKVSILAPKLDTVTGKKRRGAISSWRRMGDACKMIGLALDSRHAPVDGWRATEGQECRVAVDEYNGKPSLVWGKPSGKFPDEYKDDAGKHRDYGCGILPAE